MVTELDQKVYKSNTPGVFNGRMVVTKKFKYFLFDQGANKEQLFDLENDPGELHPVTYDPAYHDDLLACRAKLKEWVATQNDDFDVDAAIYSVKYDVKRLNKGQPIITQQMFSELGVADEGENINGPGVIRIPEWISPENRAHPDAEYYCYFAHHDGEYIRMAWASDIDSPDIGQFRNSYQKAFLRKDMSYMGKRVPFAYIWDDHDFGPNNSDKTAPGRLQSGRAYRECIPHYPLAASEKNGAIYQAFTVNNTRFVVTDLRSRRDENDKPDNAQKSMMGKEQFSWFMNEIKESSEKYPLVIWVSSVPYTAEKKEGEDDWGGFTHERRVIANFIKKNDINNLMIVSGDAHCTLYNNGLENNYSNYEGEGLFEILASPLDNWATSVKGGSWTDVYRPKDGQLVYGMAEVVFSNNKTTVHFKTFDTNHQVVIQAEKSFKIENKKD